MKVIILDFDGVIADSLDEIYPVCKQLAAKHGVNIKSEKDFVNLFDENFYQAIVEHGFPKKEIPLLVKELTAVLPKRMEKIKLFPGIEQALETIHEKHALIVITSNMTPVVKKYLDLHNIPVKSVIGADIETSKVKKLQQIQKDHPKATLIYVGDTKGDIIEGRQAGAKIIAVTWGYHSEEKLRDADLVVHKPEELVDAIENI
ncbi:HAD hydrolase-like protein [Candidatus Woesearchaeota archaeon]|nr:HAD hydrolase-like protein [Candidatus Woesearchaeota archaeon]